MGKKKNKFDLSYLVHQGNLKEGQALYFVSDPSKTCTIVKQPNHEYKVVSEGETFSIHGFAQKCLGQEPTDHASKWLRTQDGKTLYDLWHADDMIEAA